MNVHVMLIRDNNLDKVKKGKFELRSHFNITTNTEWEALKRMAIEATANDGHGRIICSGNVHYKADNQNRLFTCKIGHNVTIPYKIVDWQKEDWKNTRWFFRQNALVETIIRSENRKQNEK